MKYRCLCFTAIALMAFLVTFLGCGKKVDLVNNIQPVSTDLADVRVTMEQLAQLPPDQRAARLQRDWPHLAEEVPYYARAHGLISQAADVERVEFLFGSLDRVRANDGAGVEHEGYAKNQLIARVRVRGQSQPVDLFVFCLNGMVADPKDVGRLQSLGERPPVEQFEIKRGEGLVRYHVDYPLAIDLAERFSLPLYRGRAMIEEDRITPDRARRMEPDVARVQVTVLVNEGDRFDLVTGTYTPAPKKVVPPRKAGRSGRKR